MSLDPVLLAVIANRMDSIVREMENTLLRSGRSAVFNQARDFSCALVTGDARLLASAEGLPVGRYVVLRSALGLMPPAAAQARQTAFTVLVEVALDGAPGDVGVGGDVVVGEAVALEPEDLHLALDAGVGVMEAVVGQGSPVFGSETDRPHDSPTRGCPQSFPRSSLCPCTATCNLCQIRSRRVYLRSHHWSNREYEGYQGLQEEAIRSVRAVCEDAERLKTIGNADYINRRA